MNRLFLCCALSCTVATCTLNSEDQKPVPEQTQKEAPQIPEQAKKIARENISTSITEYLSSICEKKGFLLNQIPENMAAESQTKISHIITLLSETMVSNNRIFVYQHEIETLTQKTFEFFLARVHAALLTEIGNEIFKNLDTSALARQSSKVILPEDVRTKVSQSKLFKRH